MDTRLMCLTILFPALNTYFIDWMFHTENKETDDFVQRRTLFVPVYAKSSHCAIWQTLCKAWLPTNIMVLQSKLGDSAWNKDTNTNGGTGQLTPLCLFGGLLQFLTISRLNLSGQEGSQREYCSSLILPPPADTEAGWQDCTEGALLSPPQEIGSMASP